MTNDFVTENGLAAALRPAPERDAVLSVRSRRLNSEVITVDRTRTCRMAGRMPAKAGSIDGSIETAFNIVDLIFWVVDLFGAFLDLLRDFGVYLSGE